MKGNSDYLIILTQINFIPVHKLDRFTDMGYYEMNRGKFVEYIKQCVSKEDFNKLGFNQYDTLHSIIHLLNYVYTNYYSVTKSPKSFHINTDLLALNLDNKMYRRYNRLIKLLNETYTDTGLKGIPIKPNYVDEEGLNMSLNIYISKNIKLNVHPRLFRLIGRNDKGDYVITRKRVTDSNSTGITEFQEFLNVLKSKKFIDNTTYNNLENLITKSFNLRYKI